MSAESRRPIDPPGPKEVVGPLMIVGAVLVILLCLGITGKALFALKERLFSGHLVESAPESPSGENFPRAGTPAPVPEEEEPGQTAPGEDAGFEPFEGFPAPPGGSAPAAASPDGAPAPAPRGVPAETAQGPAAIEPGPGSRAEPGPPAAAPGMRGDSGRVEVADPWRWTPIPFEAGPVRFERWKFQTTAESVGLLVAGNASDRPVPLGIVVTARLDDGAVLRFRDSVKVAPGPPAEIEVALGSVARRKVLRKVRALSLEATILVSPRRSGPQPD